MELRPGCHVHLMGICGTAMASLAGLLKDRGFHVTGSDAHPYPPMSTQIENLGIQLQKGYRAENLQPKPDFVIVGNVISANNPEAIELNRLQIPFTSLPKAMGELIIAEKESIVVSGTHGKTTTTSLMAWILEQAQEKPGFLIGGIPKNFAQSFRNPEKKYFVIEGDEYDTAYFDKVPKFIHYKPRHVILTSVEFDHADIYKDLDDVKKSFTKLMELIPVDGHLVACYDDQNVRDLIGKTKCKNVYTYGLTGGDYQVFIQSEKGEEIVFQLNHQGQLLGEFHLPMAGQYNVLNATAVIVMALQLGLKLEQIQKSLTDFLGVKRRQEVLGEPGGVLLIEDFAHHPTAVRETIKGIHAKYHGRKVFSVFEPRSATSRRKVFQKDYVEAFKNAHEVILAEAFDQSKIDSENRFSSGELVDDLKNHQVTAHVFSGADQIVQYIQAQAKPGDAVLIMSNGGFDGIYGKLTSALEKT